MRNPATDFPELVKNEVSDRLRSTRWHSNGIEITVEEQERRQKLAAKVDSGKRLYQGTRPEKVLHNHEDAALCDEFLEYMGERSFAGATMLTHHRLLRPNWALRGYGVAKHAVKHTGTRLETSFMRTGSDMTDEGYEFDTGYTVQEEVPYEESYSGTTWVHNIFLCEDGLLRRYVNVRIERGLSKYQGDALTPNHVSNLPTTRIPEMPQGVRLERLLVDYAATAELDAATPEPYPW